MSGKQNNKDQNTQNKRTKTKEGETFTNPAFPNKLFKKINGKDVIVGYKLEKTSTVQGEQECTQHERPVFRK